MSGIAEVLGHTPQSILAGGLEAYRGYLAQSEANAQKAHENAAMYAEYAAKQRAVIKEWENALARLEASE